MAADETVKEVSWMKSLLKCIDRFFFGTDDEQENEIKPYFYVALLFGMIMALVIVVKLF